jgi:DNA invertase Pin-like site-specific DNA recombinase
MPLVLPHSNQLFKIMRIGYARVSTDEQTTNPQIDALNAYGCETIYHEQKSGKHTDRAELENCLHALRKGDTLVVWRLDRLGRSLADLIRIVNHLETQGIGFASLTEQIDTATPAGKLVFHVFGALSEFERNLIRERTMAGLKAARARGKNGGRPAKLTGNNLNMAKTLMQDKTNNIQDIAHRFGVSRSTLYRLTK